MPSSPKKPSRDAAMFSTEQDSITSESSNAPDDRPIEINTSEAAGISLSNRLKGFGRSFTSKLQGVIASIKKVKIFEFSKEPSLSVPTGDDVSAEDGIYYVAPTKAASKDKVSSAEEIMASSAEPTVHEARRILPKPRFLQFLRKKQDLSNRRPFQLILLPLQTFLRKRSFLSP